MAMRLSGIDVRYLVRELVVLEGAKIDKVFMQDDLLVLGMRTGQAKTFLHCRKELVYQSDNKIIEQTQDHPFCRLLRKQLAGAALKTIRQVASERLIRMELEARSQPLTMIIELFAGGNVLLLKDEIILGSWIKTSSKERSLRPGVAYRYAKQPYDCFSLTPAQVRDILLASRRQNIVKALAIDLFLGGVFAEEVVLRCGLTKDAAPSQADAKVVCQGIRDLLHEPLAPVLLDGHAYPFAFKSKSAKTVTYPTFSKAIEASLLQEQLMPSGMKAAHDRYEHEITRLEKLIALQEKQCRKLEEDASKDQSRADALYACFSEVEQALKEAKSKRQKKTEVDLL